MSQEEFNNLNQLFTLDSISFDRTISQMTSDELDRYLQSQTTTHVFEYFQVNRPRFFIQAMWARESRLRDNRPKNREFSHIQFEFPANFNPHDKMTE